MPGDLTVPHFNIHTAVFEPLPEFGGSKAILYESPDKRTIAGSFKESGTHRLLMPFDEFIYVVAGGVKITVEGAEMVSLTVGDVCYLKQGRNVLFEMTDDFHDVTVLISDKAIEL